MEIKNNLLIEKHLIKRNFNLGIEIEEKFPNKK